MLFRTFFLSLVILTIFPAPVSIADCSEQCDNGNEYQVSTTGDQVNVFTYDASEGEYTLSVYDEQEDADDTAQVLCDIYSSSWCDA